ncbi:CAP domain-containing protein [Rhodobacteraceae bacterium 2CG4]|uniref:CAP domain-containing protein n=1 Tax=Halovulum marinum TaxID=2662447 RepID=A0A6L5Z3Y8_9RHOB|nr:CAP domain-containing protein [Halovulum marinum]MSU90704.1 CAP domain-containing protein [Halovulum marinum]
MSYIRGFLLLLSLGLLAACTTPPPEQVGGVQMIREADTQAVMTSHVDALNAYRATRGLRPVTLSARLTAAARTHARDMSVQERAWHFGSDGTSPRDRAERAGFAGRVLGENISESFDDELQVLQSWIDDPVTRSVMLSPEADSVGLGWFQESDGKLWWVQLLGQSSAPLIASRAGFAPPTPES